MACEIERRFLLSGEDWRAAGTGLCLRQGFVSLDAHHSVRVRIAGEQAWLTIKGEGMAISRPEFEYAIPLADAEAMLAGLCRYRVDKLRTRVRYAGKDWVIDEFFGDNAGLVLAEIELASEQEAFVRPPWLGAEVTSDARFSYAYLSQTPYSRWTTA
ncbi:CYTH domain-containing protein [Craterilacuibacter sp. RT1T]|uniref:CYTH domain-containing protein n=1 Tax=Craterilacuibacter sp. RT1T TaxID=2942211 RepID=UPI0020C0071E|nr:CYTH domain-containing protein [Craterilacuibacter sp. RT1T]MCL6263500.1 CYTH domain-containing protein [Craterilacuibacter sp. RT1T]